MKIETFKDKNELVSFTEFLINLSDKITERRENMVRKDFIFMIRNKRKNEKYMT